MKKLKKLLATMSAVVMCAVSITPFVSNAIYDAELGSLRNKITDYTTSFTLEDGHRYVFNKELTYDLFDGKCGRIFLSENRTDRVCTISVTSEVSTFGIDCYMLNPEKILILEDYLTANNIPYIKYDDYSIDFRLEIKEQIRVMVDIKEKLGILPFAGFLTSLSEIEILSVENTFPEKTLDGDANEDGKTDIADATAIMQHIGNRDKYALTVQGEVNADCYNTGDGITGMDAVAIQQLKTGMIQSLDEV